MNTKKYVIGSIVVFVVMFILEYVLHDLILGGQYEATKEIYRTEEAMMQYFPAMILGYLMMSFGFCYIFIQGYKGKGCAEGIRYGLIIAFTFAIPSSLIYYTVFPMSGWMMLGYFIAFPIETMILGAIIASIYKP
ncbi:hypothetical protein ACFLQG_00425 [Candidatus Zixiibacteriota bacterium]